MSLLKRNGDVFVPSVPVSLKYYQSKYPDICLQWASTYHCKDAGLIGRWLTGGPLVLGKLAGHGLTVSPCKPCFCSLVIQVILDQPVVVIH